MIFMMEKELRSFEDRGHFPMPTITPQGARIENPNQIRKTLEAVDEEIAHIIATVRESKRSYEKKKKRLESENNLGQQDHHKDPSTTS